VLILFTLKRSFDGVKNLDFVDSKQFLSKAEIGILVALTKDEKMHQRQLDTFQTNQNSISLQASVRPTGAFLF
jgi:hypothetical protein